MPRNKKTLLTLSVILFSFYMPTQAQISINKVFYENNGNPAGISGQDIRFSWQPYSEENGKTIQQSLRPDIQTADLKPKKMPANHSG